MLVTKQLAVMVDFHGIFFILWKSVVTLNCLVTHSLQNILKKNNHPLSGCAAVENIQIVSADFQIMDLVNGRKKGLEQLEVE